MAATKREQLEKLVRDMQVLADAADLKGDFSSEDRQKVIDMMADSKRLADEITAEATISGGLSDAKAFLAALAAPPGENGKKGETHDLTVSGLPMNPPGNKTLGELFIESPAYGDFKARYGDSAGLIKASTKGIQSGLFTADTKDLITSAATSAGAAVRNDMYPTITDLVGDRELTVDDLVSKGTTTSDTIEYVRITGKTNNASPVVEASAASGTWGIKPESALALEVVSTTVKTIAHWMPITKRAASDAPQVRSLIDSFLRYGLDEELEDQELNGSGTGENFEGITTAVTETVGSAGTDIDAIVDAIRTVRITGRRRPNAVVFNPLDWYSTSFLLAKDGVSGGYLIGDPRASVDQLNQLWGLKVVVTPAMAENSAVVGDFRYAMRWAREGVSISVSDSHEDFFVRNLLVILGERRDAFGVLDIGAFCEVTAL